MYNIICNIECNIVVISYAAVKSQCYKVVDLQQSMFMFYIVKVGNCQCNKLPDDSQCDLLKFGLSIRYDLFQVSPQYISLLHILG